MYQKVFQESYEPYWDQYSVTGTSLFYGEIFFLERLFFF
jgi:hypothetical protein